jgi:hypothetical protein
MVLQCRAERDNTVISRDFVEKKFPNLFKGIGCLSKKHHIEKEKDAKPVVIHREMFLSSFVQD